MQQRQVASVNRQEMAVKAATLRFEDPARHGVVSPKKLLLKSAALARPHSSHSHQPETAESTETDLKRRMRADARRALMNYSGTAWDAVKANDLEILQCFVLVEGTSRLLSRGSPDLIDGGRSLLHCAA
uniref:Uncharacterized protein n=1 Tax=Globisporangium ultimum (strain ATCC 200006 / CBS 805.95 / DAOM BR144) TaxID=431595 RepID=K3X4C8_GLOUD